MMIVFPRLPWRPALCAECPDLRRPADARELAARTLRDQSEASFRKRMRGLIGELTQQLEALSPFWLAFGLKQPGAIDAPDAPANTRLTALGGGKLRAQCDPAPRADYYQFWVRTGGADAPFELADSPREPEKILENLSVRAALTLKIRAVNATGPGPYGDEAQGTVT